MTKISVIVPVYNVEDYLDETMDSIVKQTIFDDMEVLLIDDGSTDSSRYLVEKYALDYDNIRAYHKQNEGLPITRNYGLKFAEGEYVHFMDPDDYLVPDAYEKLYNLAVKNDVDIVCGNMIRFANYNVWDSVLYINAYDGIDSDIELTTLYDEPSLLWNTSACAKLFKREFLTKNDLEFINEKILYEDLLFSLESFILADSIAISTDYFYYWRLRTKKTSITQQEDSFKNFHDRLEILRLSHELFGKYNVDLEFINNLYDKWLNHDFMLFITNISNFPEDYFRKLVDESKEILEYIPIELKRNLNSYEKIVYKMIENRDYDALKSFADVYDEWVENPFVPENLDEKYAQYIDFDRDSAKEEFIVDLRDFKVENDGIMISFDENFKFLSKNTRHMYTASLIDESDCGYPLKIIKTDKKYLFIPFSLLEGKKHLKIRMIYTYGDVEKDCTVKVHSRKSVERDDCYIEFGLGINWKFHIDIVPKAENEITVSDVIFEDGKFKLTGKYQNRADKLFIKNILDGDEISYNITHGQDNTFSVEIPYDDILSKPIKKWELNFKDAINCIKLDKNFIFYSEKNKIDVKNARNKILINNTLVNVYDEAISLHDNVADLKSQRQSLRSEKNRLSEKNRDLKKKNDKLNRKMEKLQKRNETLKSKNEKLKDKNKLLNQIIDEYKSRKVIVVADKIKKIKK